MPSRSACGASAHVTPHASSRAACSSARWPAHGSPPAAPPHAEQRPHGGARGEHGRVEGTAVQRGRGGLRTQAGHRLIQHRVLHLRPAGKRLLQRAGSVRRPREEHARPARQRFAQERAERLARVHRRHTVRQKAERAQRLLCAGADGGDPPARQRAGVPSPRPNSAPKKSCTARRLVKATASADSMASRRTAPVFPCTRQTASSSTAAPRARSRSPSREGSSPHARQQNPRAGKAARRGRGEAIGQRHRLPHHDERRGVHMRFPGAPLEIGQRRAHRALLRQRRVLNHGGGRLRVHAGADQARRDFPQQPQAHEEHERVRGVRQGIEVEVGEAAAVVRRHHAEAARHAAVRHRGCRRAPARRTAMAEGHARHHL